MRILLLTLLGCLFFTRVSAQDFPDASKPRRGQQKELSRGQEKALEKEQENSSGGAHLHMKRASCNFGDVSRKGGELVKEFEFTNDGTVPLVVTRVVTSCSCLKASYSKRPVKPGESGVIRITYEPLKSEPGVFNKVIQIYSNSVDGRDVITVQGNSIEEQAAVKVKGDKIKVKR